jgi:hypothetical protein
MNRALLTFAILVAAAIGYATMTGEDARTDGVDSVVIASATGVEQQFQTRFCYAQYRDQTDIANCLKRSVR